jgi:hypothetical protein
MAEEKTPTEGQVADPAPAVEGQAAVPTPSQPAVTAEDFLADTKFKDFDAAGKSMKEGQATITKLSQEKKELEAALQGMSNVQNQQPPVTQGQAPDFFDAPEVNVDRRIDAKLASAFRSQKAGTDIEVLRETIPDFAKHEEIMKNDVYVRKPYLNTMGKKGLMLAYEEAKEIRKSQLKELKAEIMGETTDGGDNLSPEEKMRADILAEIEQKQGATLTPGGVRTSGSDDHGKARAEAVKKGDVDGVLDHLIG